MVEAVEISFFDLNDFFNCFIIRHCLPLQMELHLVHLEFVMHLLSNPCFIQVIDSKTNDIKFAPSFNCYWNFDCLEIIHVPLSMSYYANFDKLDFKEHLPN